MTIAGLHLGHTVRQCGWSGTEMLPSQCCGHQVLHLSCIAGVSCRHFSHKIWKAAAYKASLGPFCMVSCHVARVQQTQWFVTVSHHLLETSCKADMQQEKTDMSRLQSCRTHICMQPPQPQGSMFVCALCCNTYCPQGMSQIHA